MALIHIGGKSYEIVHENRNGWNPEAFRDRYSEVLERYDFIVGDWGYSQLRLKGFFRDNHSKASKDSTFSNMPDYINEYCNFGCAYFILEKTQSTKKEPEDYDFDLEDQHPRLDAADLREAAEAGYSELFEAGEAEDDEVAGAREAAVVPTDERHNRGPRGDNRSGGDNRGGGGRREQQQRKGYRGNDHRGKKPIRLAASETAAAAAPAEMNRPNKDTGRS